MRNVGIQKLRDMQWNPSCIRNLCVLAHVDHGKTTLVDSLVASNGIISAAMAGKLRYMDSRSDEQQRGITMKSSSIALHHAIGDAEYLVNVVDSPGHVDFSSEVSTAVRLCDGAVVLVDAVEGVCPQTKVALKHAWVENLRPVLVLNKIDRLILEMKLSPLDAYVHISQVLEQVNAVMGELFATEVLGREVVEKPKVEKHVDSTTYDWSSGLEEEDDSELYFSPDQGNVAFASAVDGWAFRTQDFANIFATKLGVKEEVLVKTIWGDFYLNSKTKRIMKGAQAKAKKPLFVQFVLENLWSVYETIAIRRYVKKERKNPKRAYHRRAGTRARKNLEGTEKEHGTCSPVDKEKLQKIAESLNIKLTTRDLRHTDPRVQLQAVLGQWLPLSKTLLDMVCSKLPSPSEITEEKVEKLICSQTKRFDSLPEETQKLKAAFVACSSSDEVPVIAYISKMIPVDRKSLPQNRPRPLTAEEIARRRELAKQRHAEKMLQEMSLKSSGAQDAGTPLSSTVDIPKSSSEEVVQQEPKEPESDDVFIAFSRVFSGTVKRGQCLYVLGPKHDPADALEKLQNGEEINPELTLKDLKSGQHVTKVEISDLYILMGRELESVEEAPAGNMIGIGGLEEHVLKSATLSSTLACPSFTELQLMAVPILRVAVEPKKHQDMPSLVRGLKLLNQADACVQVFVQETGEHVLVTVGEVHLERCLDDLKERYAKVDLNVSEPIVQFRETIVIPPKMDMVNESIAEQKVTKKEAHQDILTIQTSNKQSTIQLRAVPLPNEVTRILDESGDLLKTIERSSSQEQETALTSRTLEAIAALKQSLCDAFNEAEDKEWSNAVDHIWSFGPRRNGTNILLNRIPSYKRNAIWGSDGVNETSQLNKYDSSFVNGFQMATLAGPLCEEPMMGVCFVIEDWSFKDNSEEDNSTTMDTSGSLPFGPFSGQVMSAVKEGCRRAFQAQPQRLMVAMYSCGILVNAEVLGKMYAVLGRRHGRVLHGDQQEGSATFSVTAVLPVVESFSFAAEIRKQTSGLASPQLVFSHWEVLDIDPYWTPSTEEEYLHFGEKADSANRARCYMDSVRRRKGLAVEEKLVEHAEKQRTLSKNK